MGRRAATAFGRGGCRLATAARALGRPSLVRRVVLALLTAVALLWCVLIGLDYLDFKRQVSTRQAMEWVEEVLAESLSGTSATEACAIVGAIELSFNRSRRESGLEGIEDMKFRLDGPTGAPLCASPGMEGELVIEGTGEAPVLTLAGRGYWAATRPVPPWHLTFAEPRVSDATYLRWLVQGYVPPFAVAIPLLVLPLWFVVWRGLLPLRALASRVAARDPADVSPLGLELRQAELQPLEAAFDQLLAKARHGLARERAFVLDAAHELRTPLAVIAAQAHAVSGTSGERQRDARAALDRAVARASHLMHQLLTLSRVEDVVEGHARRVDLVELTRQGLVAHAPVAEERSIELSLEAPERLMGALSEALFHGIVENLLANALAYCPGGARVEVRLRRAGERVHLEVRDDGPGIDEADRAHLFERFRRGRDARASGTGLGLAIVRATARAMGGTVALVEGIEGRGVGFLVEIECPDAPSDGSTSGTRGGA